MKNNISENFLNPRLTVQPDLQGMKHIPSAQDSTAYDLQPVLEESLTSEQSWEKESMSHLESISCPSCASQDILTEDDMSEILWDDSAFQLPLQYPRFNSLFEPGIKLKKIVCPGPTSNNISLGLPERWVNPSPSFDWPLPGAQTKLVCCVGVCRLEVRIRVMGYRLFSPDVIGRSNHRRKFQGCFFLEYNWTKQCPDREPVQWDSWEDIGCWTGIFINHQSTTAAPLKKILQKEATCEKAMAMELSGPLRRHLQWLYDNIPFDPNNPTNYPVIPRKWY